MTGREGEPLLERILGLVTDPPAIGIRVSGNSPGLRGGKFDICFPGHLVSTDGVEIPPYHIGVQQNGEMTPTFHVLSLVSRTKRSVVFVTPGGVFHGRPIVVKVYEATGTPGDSEGDKVRKLAKILPYSGIMPDYLASATKALSGLNLGILITLNPTMVCSPLHCTIWADQEFPSKTDKFPLVAEQVLKILCQIRVVFGDEWEHRDIKPANIISTCQLTRSPLTGVGNKINLIDFEMSGVRCSGGTIQYSMGRGFGDVASLALTIAVLCCFKIGKPFPEETFEERKPLEKKAVLLDLSVNFETYRYKLADTGVTKKFLALLHKWVDEYVPPEDALESLKDALRPPARRTLPPTPDPSDGVETDSEDETR
jgi:hypothetical protein